MKKFTGGLGSKATSPALLFALPLILSSGQAVADWNQTAVHLLPAEFQMSPEQINALLPRVAEMASTPQSFSRDSLSLTSPYRTHLAKIHVHSESQLQLGEALTPGLFPFRLLLKSPRLEIESLQIRDEIIREVGGSRIRVRIEADCQDLFLQSPRGGWAIEGLFQLKSTGAGLEFHVVDPEVSVIPSPWDFQVRSCQGPRGIEREIARGFREALKDVDLLAKEMIEGLRERLELYQIEFQARLEQSSEFTITDTLSAYWTPLSIEGGDQGGFTQRGELALVHRASPRSFSTQSPDRGPLPRSANTSGLRIHIEAIDEILHFAERSGLIHKGFYSNEYSELDALFKSRMNQWFAWPDLMQFRTSDIFWFSSQPSAKPEILLLTGKSQGFTLQMSTPLHTRLFAPIQGSYVPYVDFLSSSRSLVDVRVTPEDLRINLEIYALRQISYAFTREIKELRSVNEHIGVSALENRLAGTRLGEQHILDLPTLPLLPNFNLQMSDIQLDPTQQVLRLDFAH